MDATTTFEAWALPNPVKDALSKQGIVTPTQIQEQTIPAALEGKDLIGHAINGTGKTLAFCLPLISLLDRNENRDKIGLVLAPNDDVASQVNDVIKKLTSKMTGRWKPVLVTASSDIGYQEEGLRKRPRMIVATPNQLLGHINSGIAKLDNVKFVVLEETDRILEQGQIESLLEILDVVPKERQTLLFTTTMQNEIEALSEQYLNSPSHFEGGKAHIPEATPVVMNNNPNNEEEPGKFDSLLTGIETHPGSILVFCRSKFRARKIAQRLNKLGITTDCIHGERSNNQKQQTIDLLVEGQLRIVISTDTVIGDIKLEQIPHLANFDLLNLPSVFTDNIQDSALPITWVTPNSIEQWQELQAGIAACGAERIEEIKKQKAIARENGELPERPRHKKKPHHNNNKHQAKKKRAPSYDIPDEDRQPSFDNYADDDDSQIFFQPSVEEQLNQLDSIIKKKTRGYDQELRRQTQHARAAQRIEGDSGNSGAQPRRKKHRPGGNRGGRGNGNGFYP